MKNKLLESLNSPLFLLPIEAQLKIQGGLLANENSTREMILCEHGNDVDCDGYTHDTETTN